MKIIGKTENKDIATVYLGEFGDGKVVEFVESVQPPIPREKKWVLIISTLYGCPVSCKFCDSGNYYKGKLNWKELFAQIDYPIRQRYPDGKIPAEKFKIQFARMGEPAFNSAVLDVLEDLPTVYQAPGLMPSISTIAPNGSDKFFIRLMDIKNRLYKDKFQMQFSIHTTNQEQRDWLLPVKKWSFDKIAEYGNTFFKPGDRKITLNFALAGGMELSADKLLRYFNPDKFLVKVTPVNPTYKARDNNIESYILPEKEKYDKINSVKNAGYDVLLSIGELEENNIGSNCGQYLTTHLNEKAELEKGYTYELQQCK